MPPKRRGSSRCSGVSVSRDEAQHRADSSAMLIEFGGRTTVEKKHLTALGEGALERAFGVAGSELRQSAR